MRILIHFRRPQSKIPIITLNDEPETAENVEEGPTTNASPENEFENIVSPDLRDKIFDEISSRLGSDEDDERNKNSSHDQEKEAEPEVEKRSSEVKKDEVRVRSIEVELSAEEEQKRSSLYTLIVPFDEENETY